MRRSDMVRLLTAFVNLNCCKTKDEFSGDYLMTLDEGNKLLTFVEKQGMTPPPTTDINEVMNRNASREWESEDEAE